MKKIVSLLAALTMTVSVFATALNAYAANIQYDNVTYSGYYIIQQLPSKAEVEARRPELGVTMQKLTLPEAQGLNMMFAMQNQTKDIYELNVSITKLGEYINGFDSSFASAYMAINSVGFALKASGEYDLATNAKAVLVSNSVPATDGAVSFGPGPFGLAFTVSANATDKPLPVAGSSGAYVSDYPITIRGMFAVPAGATFDLTPWQTSANIFYSFNSTSDFFTISSFDNKIAGGKLVVGTPADTKPIVTIEKMDKSVGVAKAFHVDVKVEANTKTLKTAPYVLITGPDKSKGCTVNLPGSVDLNNTVKFQVGITNARTGSYTAVAKAWNTDNEEGVSAQAGPVVMP